MSRPDVGAAAPDLCGEQHPFLRYRTRLDSYRAVERGDLSDDRYVELVSQLDDRIAAIEGAGFSITPLLRLDALAAAAALDIELWAKVEIHSVGGSHKARHLFGVAIHLLAAAELGDPVPERLAIASCGNAALAAAVVARALDRSLAVYVPTWADPWVIQRLEELGADVNRCERQPGESGDPSYLRFREAVAAGSVPFSVQGTDTPMTFDGGRTLGWEIAEQLGSADSLYVQVGGGALATATSRGLPQVRLHPVQGEGCAPLNRAWQRLMPAPDLAAAAADPEAYMYPWPDPHGRATGILDDVTYDWLPLIERTLETEGSPVVATEAHIERAYELVRETTGLRVCATGTAGFAGVLAAPPPQRERVVVLFTGIDRS